MSGKREYKKWTDDEIDFLKFATYFYTNQELAKILGRSIYSIDKMCERLGLEGKKKKLFNIPILILHRKDEFKNNRLHIKDLFEK